MQQTLAEWAGLAQTVELQLWVVLILLGYSEQRIATIISKVPTRSRSRDTDKSKKAVTRDETDNE